MNKSTKSATDHKLKYTMGNPGDIIKHGLLAEFVAWWGEIHDHRVIRMADPFGGCPWGNLEESVKTWLEILSGTVLAHAQNNGGKGRKYLGSGHLVRQVAKDYGVRARVFVSDQDENARRNLEDSGLELIVPRLPNDDGYTILNVDRPTQYDLILLDPYSDFLRDEFLQDERKRFFQIMDIINRFADLFIAVFVLDKNPKNTVGQNYSRYKKAELSGWAFSIRCPKTVNFNHYGEIILISRQIKDGRCEKLFERLQSFVRQAEDALNISLELWGG